MKIIIIIQVSIQKKLIGYIVYYSSQAYPNQNMVPYIPAKFPPPPPHHVFGIGTAP